MRRKLIYLGSLVLLLSLLSDASADLVANWPLDADAKDIIGSHDGILVGGAQITDDPERGRVLSVDGIDGRVEIPHSDELVFEPTDSFTIAVWLNIRTLPGSWAGVVTKSRDISPWYGLWVTPGNQWHFVGGEGGTNVRMDTGTAMTGWLHFAGVYDADRNTQKLYVNGTVIDESTGATITTSGAGDMWFGGAKSVNEYLDALVDDVRIYNHALTEEEIQTVMLSGGEGYPFPSRPSPDDGTLHMDTWVNFSWRAGDFAVSHDVCLGDNFDDVDAGTESTFIGNQTDTFLVAGFPGFPYPDGLVPGTTYYWRIDEVNETEPNSPWRGDIWSFSIPPKTAYFPDPADGAESVDPDGNLSWTAGFGAKLHHAYFGDNFDDVLNATGALPLGDTTFDPGPLKMAKIYYWRVDEFDIIETHKGDVWSFTTEGAVAALNPANGAVDVTQTPVLTWAPGFGASHEVYFGADTASLELKSSGNLGLGSESFEPGQLEWNTTYYWRVDEVNNANADSPWTGPLWSFTTANFLIIDDFESYNDIDENEPGSNRIYLAWIDGFDNPATNGSVVGHLDPPFYEETIVHNGNKSMPITYDNAVGKSEATLTLTSNRDWTVNGVNRLTIWYRGSNSNAAETMYVMLNGNAGVDNDNPDAALADGWTEWNIPLQAFADQGVNLSNVTSITLGLRSVTGGTGMMYFDDIQLHPPAPPEAPDGPIGLWNFDEGSGAVAGDSSGKGLDGAISSALWVSPGADGMGSCLDFDGQGTNLVDLGNFDVTGDGLTIACWYKADNLDTPGNDPRLFSKAIGGSNQDHLFMVSSSRVDNDKVLRFRLKTDGDTGELKADTVTGKIDLDIWTHVAAVWDGATMQLYKNGVKVGSLDKGGTLSTNPNANVAIGNQPVGTDGRPWDGLIDDVQIYNRGLSVDEVAGLAGL